jgi:hypothetical protein
MPINILDSIQLAALAAVGGAVPEGVIRTYKAAGAHNDTGAPVMLTMHLVPKDGAPDASNRIIYRSVPDGETDLCPELIGRGLRTGGKLHVGGVGLGFGATSIDTITG